MKTYVWIKETAISSVDNMSKGVNEMIVFLMDSNARFLNIIMSKCPAIMLAVKRTDRVIGRIILLIISMINMKFIKGSGVPVGIICVIMYFVMKFQAKIIIVIHIDNANGNVILMCAVDVKIKGNRAIKFRIIINVNMLLIYKVIPLGGLMINVFISLLILFEGKSFLFM